MSFTPSSSSHLWKKQRRGWCGSENLRWNFSGETGLEWLVGMEKAHGIKVQGGGTEREGVLGKKSVPNSPPSEHILLTATLDPALTISQYHSKHVTLTDSLDPNHNSKKT